MPFSTDFLKLKKKPELDLEIRLTEVYATLVTFTVSTNTSSSQKVFLKIVLTRKQNH